jgi:putative glutamine amidotransferase
VSYRPLIAVVSYHLDGRRVVRWPDGGYGVPAPYVEALRRAGARIAIVPPDASEDPSEVLEPFDGLVLIGGGDVDPARYSAVPDTAHNYGVEPDRDAFEIALLHEADRRHVPTLCICRGMQVMNVAFGGTLHQHLPDMDDLREHGVPLEGTQTLHAVEPAPGSRLSATTKSGPLACASHHHQGVDRVGEGLIATGRSDDGLVEAIERGILDMNARDAGWMVGVQWHPEETASSDQAQQALFDALVILAKLEGVRAGPGETRGRSRAYAIDEPDPRWPLLYEEEVTKIRAALSPGLLVRAEHIGSTAVPGLAAKPIIDISLALTRLVPRDDYAGPLRELGYAHAIDMWNDDHEYFSRENPDVDIDIHVHVCVADGAFEARHLAFRDWLRTHPEDAVTYASLKRELARRHPYDITSYVEGKSDFIRSVEDKALADATPAQRD